MIFNCPKLCSSEDQKTLSLVNKLHVFGAFLFYWHLFQIAYPFYSFFLMLSWFLSASPHSNIIGTIQWYSRLGYIPIQKNRMSLFLYIFQEGFIVAFHCLKFTFIDYVEIMDNFTCIKITGQSKFTVMQWRHA